MTRQFQVVEAKPYHVGQIVHRLRRDHAAELGALKIDAHRALKTAFDLSSFRRAWLIDGKVAALGGVTGSLISPTGTVWLSFTEDATRFPLAIIRETRKQLAEIMSTRTEIESGVMMGDAAAWRFAAFLGFYLKRHAADGTGMVTLGKLKNRSLACILRDAPEFGVPLPGGSTGVLVGYQAGA